MAVDPIVSPHGIYIPPSCLSGGSGRSERPAWRSRWFSLVGRAGADFAAASGVSPRSSDHWRLMALGLFGAMRRQAMPDADCRELRVNYGLNGVRFFDSPKAPKRIRGSFSLDRVDPRPDGGEVRVYDVSVESGARDVVVEAQWLVLAWPGAQKTSQGEVG